MKPTKSEYIIVKSSKIHNKGVFASKDIPKGTKIIEYVGDKVNKKESDKRATSALELNMADDDAYGAVYVFELNDKYDIDGNVPYNTARLINHSCSPNCEVEITDDHIWIIALRDIKKGEELGYNYGYDLENFEDHPCKCGSDNCFGYILDEEEWPKARKRLSKKGKVANN